MHSLYLFKQNDKWVLRLQSRRGHTPDFLLTRGMDSSLWGGLFSICRFHFPPRSLDCQAPTQPFRHSAYLLHGTENQRLFWIQAANLVIAALIPALGDVELIDDQPKEAYVPASDPDF